MIIIIIQSNFFFTHSFVLHHFQVFIKQKREKKEANDLHMLLLLLSTFKELYIHTIDSLG